MNKWEVKRLLKEQGKTEEDFINKNKEELLEMLNGAAVTSVEEAILDNLEPTNDLVKPTQEKVEPDYLSPEWSDYVMSQFTADELSDGAPNVHGLRRVAQKLLGAIVSTKIVQFFPATDSSTYGRASCVYEVAIEWCDGFIRIFQDAAGAYPGNTDQMYAKYPEAIATTRAEARCLRKALRIKGPASEEVCVTPTTESIMVETNITASISGAQISLIKTRCGEYKIDVEKFINHYLGVNDAIEKLSREQAQTLCQKINEFQTQRTDIVEEIKL